MPSPGRRGATGTGAAGPRGCPPSLTARAASGPGAGWRVWRDWRIWPNVGHRAQRDVEILSHHAHRSEPAQSGLRCPFAKQGIAGLGGRPGQATFTPADHDDCALAASVEDLVGHTRGARSPPTPLLEGLEAFDFNRGAACGEVGRTGALTFGHGVDLVPLAHQELRRRKFVVAGPPLRLVETTGDAVVPARPNGPGPAPAVRWARSGHDAPRGPARPRGGTPP